MELFADGAHVWLRSRAHAAYLYADEDGSGVSWSPGRASLNTAWKVHRLVRGGTSYVLLHGAAYGRYLGLTPDDAPPAPGIDRVCRPVQLAYGTPEQDDVLWEAFEAEDGSGDVHMCHRTYGKCRDFSHPSTMMGWIVEAIPPREDPPELPPVIPVHRVQRLASVNTAWQVHRVQRDGNDYVLLHSAAYGRYLALSPNPAPPGHRGRRAVQNIYDTPQQVDIAWEAIEVGDHVVLLLHVSNRLLRANGRYCRWNNGVSVDDVNNQSTTMHWKVEAIPPRAEPPALPFSPAVHRVQRDGNDYVLLHSLAYARYLALSPDPAPPVHRGRRAVQNVYGDPLQEDIVWEDIAVGDHIILMRHVSNRLLRANGRYLLWNNGVSVDDINNQSTMMHWKIPDIAMREIVHVLADNHGNLNPNTLRIFTFPGRSVYQLRTAVAIQRG
ncbi:hypothetical protein BAE44_0006219 [Dichanthelium oligosanthes]|uniref:DUF569 domain-containing protein n=1 Tax=Dichanthelium oligosanthes TaxID=888268 RepID=A0A1E5W5S6_9POAL|nr:hypothetical protein BAE44_0006219 [Dichanthelium oligosanthes]